MCSFPDATKKTKPQGLLCARRSEGLFISLFQPFFCLFLAILSRATPVIFPQVMSYLLPCRCRHRRHRPRHLCRARAPTFTHIPFPFPFLSLRASRSPSGSRLASVLGVLERYSH